MEGFDAVNKWAFLLTHAYGIIEHPDNLLLAYNEIYRVTKRYIICMEYFSPECREINYRGEEELLWSNDFGKIWLENFPLRCIGYGFSWKKMSGLDNLNWFIFEKVN